MNCLFSCRLNKHKNFLYALQSTIFQSIKSKLIKTRISVTRIQAIHFQLNQFKYIPCNSKSSISFPQGELEIISPLSDSRLMFEIRHKILIRIIDYLHESIH